MSRYSWIENLIKVEQIRGNNDEVERLEKLLKQIMEGPESQASEIVAEEATAPAWDTSLNP